MRLYCNLTKGTIPQVCGQKSKSFLERQVVRLAPFHPLVGPSSCRHCKCGQSKGVAHTAFECPELVVQRRSLISPLTWRTIPLGDISPTPESWHSRFAHRGLAQCRRLRPALSTVLVQGLGVGFMRMRKRCWGRRLRVVTTTQGGRHSSSGGGVWRVASPSGEAWQGACQLVGNH